MDLFGMQLDHVPLLGTAGAINFLLVAVDSHAEPYREILAKVLTS
jgi:hypothetical protein